MAVSFLWQSRRKSDGNSWNELYLRGQTIDMPRVFSYSNTLESLITHV